MLVCAIIAQCQPTHLSKKGAVLPERVALSILLVLTCLSGEWQTTLTERLGSSPNRSSQESLGLDGAQPTLPRPITSSRNVEPRRAGILISDVRHSPSRRKHVRRRHYRPSAKLEHFAAVIEKVGGFKGAGRRWYSSSQAR